MAVVHIRHHTFHLVLVSKVEGLILGMVIVMINLIISIQYPWWERAFPLSLFLITTTGSFICSKVTANHDWFSSPFPSASSYLQEAFNYSESFPQCRLTMPNPRMQTYLILGRPGGVPLPYGRGTGERRHLRNNLLAYNYHHGQL